QRTAGVVATTLVSHATSKIVSAVIASVTGVSAREPTAFSYSTRCPWPTRITAPGTSPEATAARAAASSSPHVEDWVHVARAAGVPVSARSEAGVASIATSRRETRRARMAPIIPAGTRTGIRKFYRRDLDGSSDRRVSDLAGRARE